MRKILSLLMVLMLFIVASVPAYANEQPISKNNVNPNIILDVVAEMEEAGQAVILESDNSNDTEYIKVQYDNNLVEEITHFIDSSGQSCYTVISGDITNNLIINEKGIYLDGFEVKPTTTMVTPYGVGATAYAWSSTPWGSSAEYISNSTTYIVDIPFGQNIINVAFSVAAGLVSAFYKGNVISGVSIASAVYALLQSRNGDASHLYWKENRKENLVLAGIYTQYFKLSRSYYLNSACTNPIYDSTGTQVKETIYQMKSTNY